MPIDCLGEIMFERTNVSPHMAIFEVLPVTLSGRRLLRLAAKELVQNNFSVSRI
jgi:hypothetical protein